MPTEPFVTLVPLCGSRRAPGQVWWGAGDDRAPHTHPHHAHGQ